MTNSAISIDSVYEDKSDVKTSIDDVTEQETIEKTESKPKRTVKRKSQANQKQVKKTSKHTNKKDKSDNVDEIAETKGAVTPRKQKKVETKKHTKIKTGDQEEKKKITKPRKTAPKKKPPVKEKAENALKPVENPKTGWWDD